MIIALTITKFCIDYYKYFLWKELMIYTPENLEEIKINKSFNESIFSYLFANIQNLLKLEKFIGNKIFQVATYIPKKVWTYTKLLNTALKAPFGISEKFFSLEAYFTKLFGATTESCEFGKGAASAAKVLACQNGVYFVVSCIGCSADGLQILACWLPDPNITTVVTMFLSWGCQTFVWACKNKTLPWKGGC